jgi:arginine decarboxylase
VIRRLRVIPGAWRPNQREDASMAFDQGGQAIHAIGDYYSAVQLRIRPLERAPRYLRANSRGIQGRSRTQKSIPRANELFDASRRSSGTGPSPAMPLSTICAACWRPASGLTWLSRRVAISRALISGAYRRRTMSAGRPMKPTARTPRTIVDLSIEARALHKPYFEVLIVDEMTDHQERFLRQSLQRCAASRIRSSTSPS